MVRFHYSKKITPIDVANELGLESREITVTYEGDEIFIDVPRDLTALEQETLDNLMRLSKSRGRVS